MSGKDEEAQNEEDIPLYEEIWAQNTSAHGLGRIANTSKFQRAVWIIALLICLAVVTWEIQKSVSAYFRYETSTEIIKENELEIEFPSVTFCNFNRWRKSKLTDEVLEQLKDVLSLYSYNYVINDLDEANSDPEALLRDQLADTETDNPTTTTEEIITTTTPVIITDPPEATPTTTPRRVNCALPPDQKGVTYTVIGSREGNNQVKKGTSIQYQCSDSNKQLIDGDTLRNCTSDGKFDGRGPICTNVEELGDRFTVRNSESDGSAIMASDPLEFDKLITEEVSICFWVYMQKGQTLGTILSYGKADESIFSVVQTAHRPNTYGLKYKFFGIETTRLTIARYEQWTPYCAQYSLKEGRSQLYILRLSESQNTFQLYSSTPMNRPGANQAFPANGRVVLFNDYINYLRQADGKPLTISSAGGTIANVNIWSRKISPEVMSAMLWEGDLFSMTSSSLPYQFGDITSSMNTYNVSVSQQTAITELAERPATAGDSEPGQRTRRQADNGDTQNRKSDDTLKKVFNYAEFTRTAGWQLVDDHSNHSENEPRTLMQCQYRGVKCDSRWFQHRFGAYGNCYTFNYGIAEKLAMEEGFPLPLIQDYPGPTGGLKISLDIQMWEYAETRSLMGNPELGLKFIVHAPYEAPVINSMGYVAGPGSKAYVGFEKTSKHNIEEPWGKCDPEKKLQYNDKYTLSGCALECKLNKVVDVCGCKPYYFPGNYEICGFADLSNCAFVEIAKINANFSQCNCPIACDAEEFGVKLSYINYPNEQYGRDLASMLDIKLPKTELGTPMYKNKVQYIRKNIVSLDMYYESMSVTEINQNKAMDVTALLGNIGGQLGLFIGCSFLTFFELLECIFLSSLYHFKRMRYQRKERQQEYDLQTIVESCSSSEIHNVNGKSNGDYHTDNDSGQDSYIYTKDLVSNGYNPTST